jgi:hypothetical protein
MVLHKDVAVRHFQNAFIYELSNYLNENFIFKNTMKIEHLYFVATMQSYLQTKANQSSNHHPNKVQMNSDRLFQISFD